MKHILEAEGQGALRRLLETRALLVFDFDGTLSPIVLAPDTARVPLPVARLMRTLSQHWPLAVVTGRAVADVAPRLDFDAWAIIGSHGAEDPGYPQAVDPAALDVVRVALHADGVGAWLKDAGVMVEDKGCSMALHYRLARDRERAHEAACRFAESFGDAIGVFEGKMVLNVVVPGSPHKGDALWRLMQRSGAEALMFVGDDVNDEPAFQVAAPDWLTIKVGRDAHSAARFFLDSTAEMPVLLEACARVARRSA